MEIAIVLLKQTCMMFLLILTGMYLFKKQFITNQGSKELGNMLLNIVLPIVIIKSFAIDFSEEKAKILIVTFIIGLFALLLSMFISHVLLKKDGVEDFASAFSNAAFIGIPLVQTVLGEEAVFYITSTVALLILLQWTYGVFLISKDKSVIQLDKLVKNPIVIAFLMGIVLFVVPIPLPEVIYNTMGAISNLNTPIAMITLGVYLAQANLKELFTSINLYKISFIRLIIIPLITLACMCLMPKSISSMNLAILIAASAPAGANVAIYAQRYNADYKKAVMLVCFSTVLSVISLPLVISIATIVL